MSQQLFSSLLLHSQLPDKINANKTDRMHGHETAKVKVETFLILIWLISQSESTFKAA